MHEYGCISLCLQNRRHFYVILKYVTLTYLVMKDVFIIMEYYLFHKKNQSNQQHILRHMYHSSGYMKHCSYSDQHIYVHNVDRTIHKYNLHHTDQSPCYTDRCFCSVQNIVVYTQSRTIHLGILLN